MSPLPCVTGRTSPSRNDSGGSARRDNPARLEKARLGIGNQPADRGKSAYRSISTARKGGQTRAKQPDDLFGCPYSQKKDQEEARPELHEQPRSCHQYVPRDVKRWRVVRRSHQNKEVDSEHYH